MRILLTAICVMCYCSPIHRKALRRRRDGLKGYPVGPQMEGLHELDNWVQMAEISGRFPTTSFEEASLHPTG